MAEKQKKAEAEAPAAAVAEKKEGAAGGGGGAKGGAGGLLSKMPVLLGGVMIVEAVVLFAGFKFLGGGAPQPAAGAELIDPAHPAEGTEGHEGTAAKGALDKNRNVEINVVEFRAQNKLSGRTFLYDVSIWVITKGEFEEKVRAVIKDREALIKDRVRTIIAQSDPEKLGGGSEPGLETLRRQVKHQLDDIIGDGMVQEVLIPRCIPFRTDF
jgi:flagellar basal body-associated protein FliL